MDAVIVGMATELAWHRGNRLRPTKNDLEKAQIVYDFLLEQGFDRVRFDASTVQVYGSIGAGEILVSCCVYRNTFDLAAQVYIPKIDASIFQEPR